MTERQILLVKNSWSYIVANSEEAGLLFYNRLFEVAPSVQHMFTTDKKEQARKLMGMVTLIVSKLQKLEDILNEIKMLAQRHNKYGAQPAHYKVVGECLIWTLEKGLGDKWNKETEEAWITVYSVLSDAMIKNQSAKAA
ncbi:MAG TPA: globin family protein [Cyclobacteriaceae bacterium]